MDNTTRFVFPTRTVIGKAVGQDLVFLIISYKLTPDDPEEFEVRFALTIEQAESISNGLSAAIQEVNRQQD